ncbi:hypothetical protein [Pseudophaeobacter sp.]|uniref:hypothetical protein n=1 Tax=Pseudophaeobacter sp. TaxID=1971739 RepID=UPI00329A308E
MIKWISSALLTVVVGTSAVSQSLTPEQIAAMVDQRVNDLNPYQALLNNPDPERSRLAMQVMLESGDAELARMALEFGLLSPNPNVKRTAFEGWLTGSPILSIRFDGAEVKDSSYPGIIKSNWNGTLDGTTGYWRVAVGEHLKENRCFANTFNREKCFITVNGDGLFFTPNNMNGRGVLQDDGSIAGVAALHNVDEPVPFSIKILD